MVYGLYLSFSTLFPLPHLVPPAEPAMVNSLSLTCLACPVIPSWCRQPGLSTRLEDLSPRVIVPDGVSRLIDLPHEYSDLILQVRAAPPAAA